MARTAKYDRDAAIESAMALFWDKGYHATSLKDLEDVLGMKPGSIYAAFESKENLYLLTLERYFAQAQAKFQRDMDGEESPLAGLASRYLAYGDLASDDLRRQACMLTKTLVDTKSTDPAINAAALTYLDKTLAQFKQAFQRAQDLGELPADADPDRLARRFQANITALRVEMHRGTSDEVIRALSEDMASELERLRA